MSTQEGIPIEDLKYIRCDMRFWSGSESVNKLSASEYNEIIDALRKNKTKYGIEEIIENGQITLMKTSNLKIVITYSGGYIGSTTIDDDILDDFKRIWEKIVDVIIEMDWSITCFLRISIAGDFFGYLRYHSKNFRKSKFKLESIEISLKDMKNCEHAIGIEEDNIVLAVVGCIPNNPPTCKQECVCTDIETMFDIIQKLYIEFRGELNDLQ